MGSNEWYTPHKYIKAARLVMDGIDLDPASTELANGVVQATRYYTKEQNGLAREWYGRVWLNPPFGRMENNKSGIGVWVKKLVQEYESGHIQQAILLSTCRTDTPWYQLLRKHIICFADHRVVFYQPLDIKIRRESDAASINGTIFVYFGAREERFVEVFSDFGDMRSSISPVKLTAENLELWQIA